MGTGQIAKYARGELEPRVLRVKHGGTPPVMLRVSLTPAQQLKLADLARAARQSVPKFVGELVRARLKDDEGGA